MDLTILYFFFASVILIILINYLASSYFKKKQNSLRKILNADTTSVSNKIYVTFYYSSKLTSKSRTFFADILLNNEMLFIFQKTKLFSGRIFQLVFNEQGKFYPESTYYILINSKKISNNCLVLNGFLNGNIQERVEITLDFLKRQSDLEVISARIFDVKSS